MLKDKWLRFRMIEGCGGGVDVGFVMIMMFDDVLFLVFDVWWWRHFSGFFQHHRQVEDDDASTDVSSTVMATLSSCQQWAQALLLSSHLSRSPFRHIKSRPGTSVICHVFMFVWQFLLFQYTNRKNIDTNTNAELDLDTYQHLNSNNIYRSTHSNPASPKGHGVVPTPTAEGKTTGCDDSPSLGLRSSGSFIWMFPKIVVPPNHPF